jgi:hypothetical protein
MDGTARRLATLTLRVKRSAEVSRLELELVRRAFELILASSTITTTKPARSKARTTAAARVRDRGDSV